MNPSDVKDKQPTLSNYLKFLIIIAIILGIISRFYNLGGKLYSLDETFSTTYIFGQELTESGIYSQAIPVKRLHDFQKVNPDETLSEGVKRIIDRPYVFPPLYPILMQFWSRFWWNDSVSPALITRSLSSLISLLSLVGMYWLCWELSGSKMLAWIGTALLAISPYHLQYAQIVRTYSLTIATTLLSSASLLRAIRIDTRKGWGLYAVNVALGLYSHLLFGFTLISQFFYVVFIEKFRISKTLRSFVTALAIGAAVFLPWFIKWITKDNMLNYATAQPSAASLSVVTLVKTWIRQISPIFIHMNDPWREFTQNFQILQRLYTPIILLLVLLSIYFICFSSLVNLKSRVLILAFLTMGGGLLMIRDVFTGNSFSTRLRYMIPYVLGIELAVTIYLSTLISSENARWQKKGAEVMLTLLIIGGIFSSGIIAKAESWSAFGAPDFPIIAKEINTFEKPLVIFEDAGDSLTMSYLLNNHVFVHIDSSIKLDKLKLSSSEDLLHRFSDFILFKPTSNSLKELKDQQTWEITPLFGDSKSRISNVWQIQKKDLEISIDN